MTVHCGLLFNVTDPINLANLRGTGGWMHQYQGWIPWILRLKLKLVLKFRIILILDIFTVNGTERPHCINALTSEIWWLPVCPYSFVLFDGESDWMIDLCYRGHFSKKMVIRPFILLSPLGSHIDHRLLCFHLSLQEATTQRLLSLGNISRGTYSRRLSWWGRR